MASRGWLVLALLIGSACGGDSGPTPPPPPPPPPPPTGTVNVGPGTAFNPTSITVNRNTTVTWAFQGGVHNVTFEDGTGSSADLSSGTHTRNFSAAGTARYRCTIHSTSFTSGMIGEVVVQ